MILYPAIDLKDAKCVRLYKGDMGTATVYNHDAASQASAFQGMGFQYLHVVDLNGALSGQSVNRPAVEQIMKKVTIPVQLGGGIRDRVGAEGWLEAGVARIIIGTAALKNPLLVRELARANPGRVVVGIDVRAGKVATDGWVQDSDVKAVDLAKRFEDVGVAAIIFTDIGRDGTLGGPNIPDAVALANAVQIPVILSGGVGRMDDIKAIAQEPRLEGAILGRALYEKAIDPRAALALTAKPAAAPAPVAAKANHDDW
jgi:phosphoribosylformimino-5-aminoimidazole carboxamide ribotide isomerase